MGWVSATQYEPEFWGKLPVVPPVVEPPPEGPDGEVEPEPEPEPPGDGTGDGNGEGLEPEATVATVEKPKVVKNDAAPAVKRVAKKTAPKAKPKVESDDETE